MKRILPTLLLLTLLVSGVGLIYLGFNQPPEEIPVAPTVVATAEQTPVGPLTASVIEAPTVDGGENGTPTGVGVSLNMTPEEMQPDHLFVPSLGIYARINTRGDFGKLLNNTLVLPHSSEVTRWQDGGSVTSAKGNIVIAGHVSFNGVHGALFSLSSIKAGNLAYITDADGNRATFQLDHSDSILKEMLPQSIWDKYGVKRLTLVTCTGKLIKRADGTWHFDSNQVATFKQVFPQSSPTATVSETQK